MNQAWKDRCPQCSWLFIGPKPSFCPHCHSALYWSTDGTESGGITVTVKAEPPRPATLPASSSCPGCGAGFIGPAPAHCPACGAATAPAQAVPADAQVPAIRFLDEIEAPLPACAPFSTAQAPVAADAKAPAPGRKKRPLAKRLKKTAMEKVPGWTLSIAVHALLLLLFMQLVYTRQPKDDFSWLEVSLYDNIGPAEKPGPGKDDKDENPGSAEEPVDPGDPVESPAEAALPAPAETPSAGQAEGESDSRPVIGSGPGQGSSGGGAGGLFSNRTGAGKGEALKRFGGSSRSEEAVKLGLKWLARHQCKGGYWSGYDFQDQCEGSVCEGIGMGGYETGHTGIALLCFLGAGHSHVDGEYAGPAGRAIEFLLSRQQQDGAFAVMNYGFMYNHAIACLALAEAYAMTGDSKLKAPVTNGIAYLLSAQQRGGGWDYIASQTGRNDTSVTGFAVMAMKSAQAAGIDVPPEAWRKARAWVRNATQPDGTVEYESLGFNGRRRWRRYGPGMSAVGLLCHLYFGETADSPYVKKTLSQIMKNPPTLEALSMEQLHTNYYWYYATLALFQAGGENFRWWNERFRDMLIGQQCAEGCQAGSWNPVDNWMSAYGGRVYSTTMNVLCLEVYYRYLPMYQSRHAPDFGDRPASGPSLDDPSGAMKIAADPSEASGKRIKALQTLEGAPGDEALAAILACLKDNNQVVRWQAVKSLGFRRDRASVPALVEAFETEDGQIGTAYVDSLGKIGGREALQALARTLAGAETKIKTKALSALKAATGKDFGEDASAWLKFLKETKID